VTDAEVNAMSALALAHMGDAVYELLVRRELCRRGRVTAGVLHRETVTFVSAGAQARAADRLLPRLSKAEANVFRRGRNAHGHAAPHAATPAEYRSATGLEALFGWLYLRGETARVEELFADILEDGA